MCIHVMPRSLTDQHVCDKADTGRPTSGHKCGDCLQRMLTWAWLFPINACIPGVSVKTGYSSQSTYDVYFAGPVTNKQKKKISEKNTWPAVTKA